MVVLEIDSDIAPNILFWEQISIFLLLTIVDIHWESLINIFGLLKFTNLTIKIQKFKVFICEKINKIYQFFT